MEEANMWPKFHLGKEREIKTPAGKIKHFWSQSQQVVLQIYRPVIILNKFRIGEFLQQLIPSCPPQPPDSLAANSQEPIYPISINTEVSHLYGNSNPTPSETVLAEAVTPRVINSKGKSRAGLFKWKYGTKSWVPCPEMPGGMGRCDWWPRNRLGPHIVLSPYPSAVYFEDFHPIPWPWLGSHWLEVESGGRNGEAMCCQGDADNTSGWI